MNQTATPLTDAAMRQNEMLWHDDKFVMHDTGGLQDLARTLERESAAKDATIARLRAALESGCISVATLLDARCGTQLTNGERAPLLRWQLKARAALTQE